MLHDDTDGLSELAKLANSLLRREYDVVVKHFRWNTIGRVPAAGVKSMVEASFTDPTVSAIAKR